MKYVLVADVTQQLCDITKDIVGSFFASREIEVTVSTAASMQQFEEILDAHVPDLAILRLGMEEEDPAFRSAPLEYRLRHSQDEGIMQALRIREISLSTALIFLSEGNGFAEECFALQALGYLKLPLQAQRLWDSMALAARVLEAKNSIIVNSDREKIKIYVSDIIYIETMMRKLIFHTVHGDIVGYGSLGGILKEFPKGEFLKISRFEAVSARWVSYIYKSRVTMKNGVALDVSSRMLSDFCDEYNVWRVSTSALSINRDKKP